ncbi:hypothetical protein [Paenibacillus sp. PL91]|uniref:hypothetical protein n=1 Tax=Paenibacillus sp. PL91 TaxID=2729538 RepID=UPI00145D7B14|nr:hypothetical protein [Paenibacillus sp. PL91]MBC9204256.1 hypothetical protein [Paenibacillus sp. PL91]
MDTNQYLLREAKSIVLKSPDASTEIRIDAPTLFILSEGCGTMTINESVTQLSFGCLLFAQASFPTMQPII